MVTSSFNRILRKIVADPVEKGIANFAKNLTEPVTAANAGTSYAESRDQLDALTKDAVDPYIPDFDDEQSDTARQQA